MTAWAAACVAFAAVVVAWPTTGRRARRRRILAGVVRPRLAEAAGATEVAEVAEVAGAAGTVPGLAGVRPRWVGAGATAVRGTLARAAGRVRAPGRLRSALLVTAGGAVATALGGPVAGVVTGCYGALAGRAVARHRAERGRRARRAELLDLLGVAAADLRAGLTVDAALAAGAGGGEGGHGVGGGGGGADGADGRLASRTRAAVTLAERTGAPLADVLERIEADGRAGDRAGAAVAAQAAGARATAWLLAGLPAGGLALGYAVGTDPLAVLLHTPIGAACAFGAVTLQLAGLAWAGRITRGAHPVAS